MSFVTDSQDAYAAGNEPIVDDQGLYLAGLEAQAIFQNAHITTPEPGQDAYEYIYSNVGLAIEPSDDDFGYIYANVVTLKFMIGPRGGQTLGLYIAGHSFTGGTLDALGLF